jgi:hypothetical protein
MVQLTQQQEQNMLKQLGSITEQAGVIQQGIDRLRRQEQYEPTTISDTNIRDNVIPELNSKIDKITETGQKYDSQGNLRNADGSIVDEYESSGASEFDEQADSIYNEQLNLLKSLQAQTDANTARQLAAIEQQFNVRESQLSEINRRNELATDTALLLGGSSRYTTSANDLSAAQSRAGLMEIAELNAMEQSLIAEVKNAQAEQNYQLASTKLGMLEQKRQEKIAKATQLAESMAEANNKLRERMRQQELGSVISYAITNGITDPSRVYDMVNGEFASLTGGATPEEFSKAFKALTPEKQTGIIAEYEYYKNEAIAQGQTPLSFDDYQTRDANRKKPVVNVSAMGLPNNIVSQVDRLSSSFDSAPITKNYNEVLNKKLSVDAIIQSGVKGPADLALVFEFMKSLDPTSVVRESEYATAAASGNIFSGWAARFNGYMSEGGGFLPEQVRADFQQLTNEKFNVIDRQYSNLRNETSRKIEMKTKPYDAGTPGSDYLTDYGAVAGFSSDVIQEQQKASDKLAEIYGQYTSDVEKLIGEGYNDEEILQILGIQY